MYYKTDIVLYPNKELNNLRLFLNISALKSLGVESLFQALARRPQFRAKIACDDFFTLFMFFALIYSIIGSQLKLVLSLVRALFLLSIK